MRSYESFLWTAFKSTGKVRDYLKFKLFEAEKTKVEAGEEFGFDKNIGNSDQNHKIR